MLDEHYELRGWDKETGGYRKEYFEEAWLEEGARNDSLSVVMVLWRTHHEK